MHRRAQMRGVGMGIAELRGPDVDAMRLRPGKIACQRHEARSDSTAEFQQALRREIREAMKQMRRGGVPAPIVHQAAVATQHIDRARSEEHTSELQSLMRISYAVFCLQKKKPTISITDPYS